MNTNNPHNFDLVSKMKSSATDISANEAILESAPQLILQIYIVLLTGEISKTVCYLNFFISIFKASENEHNII